MAPGISIVASLLSAFFLHRGVNGQRSVSVAQGRTAELPCVLDSVPSTPQVIWRNPGNQALTLNDNRVTSDTRFSVLHPYPREYNLLIAQVRPTDAGLYTCHQTGLTTTSVQLVVTEPPAITGSSPDQQVVVGGEVTVWCEASGSPDPLISWYKYTAGELQELGVTGREFTIGDAGKTEAGSYRCIADNGTPPTAMAQITVNVLFGPEVSLPQGQLSQSEGRDTMLQCLVSASPHSTSYWKHRGVMLEDSDKYQVNMWQMDQYRLNLAVLIRQLTTDDYGVYSCVAENDYGRAEDNMTLHEWYTDRPHVLHPPQDALVAVATQGVLFNCTVVGLTARDHVTWWLYTEAHGYQRIFTSNPSARSMASDPTQILSNKYEIQGHYNLYVKNVSAGDAGRYMCEVSDHSNHSAQLTTHDAVSCSSTTNASYVSQSELVTFTCSLGFAGVRPSWEVVWLHGPRTLSTVNHDTSGQMYRQITFSTRQEDSGQYTCAVASVLPEQDVGQCHLELSVLGVASTPAPVCPQPCPPALDTSTLVISTVIILSCIIIIFIILVAAVVRHYKRQISKLLEKSTSTRNQCGEERAESMELEALTTEEA